MSKQQPYQLVWQIQRTLLFWIIGLFNTVFIRPADVGTWKNWLGWLLLALALIDTVSLLVQGVQAFRGRAPTRDT
jgi:hypothetical protein